MISTIEISIKEFEIKRYVKKINFGIEIKRDRVVGKLYLS